MFALFLQLLFLTAQYASGASVVSTNHHYYKRAASDSRSPCPAMNTLANHGYINRDGTNISLSDLNAAAMSVYNIDSILANLFTHGGMLLVANTTLEGITAQTVDLADYDKHDAIEHDGSLTRLDTSQGDNHSFQPDMLTQLLADSSTDVLNIDSLAKSRVRREADMAARGNPALDAKGTFIAYGEAALILQTFGQGNNEVPKDVISSWFTNEMLPDGYVKPATVVSLSSTEALGLEIQAAAAIHRTVGLKRDFAST